MSATFLTTKKRGDGGFTLIETILYMILLFIVTGVIVQVIISIGGVYKRIKATREIESSGAVVMERVLREVRNASSVVASGSTFGSNPGAVTVSGIDEDLNNYNIAFTIDSGDILVSRDGSSPVALNSSSVDITYLLFTRVTSTNSEGVRIELEIADSLGSKSERFYGFAVLRGSY